MNQGEAKTWLGRHIFKCIHTLMTFVHFSLLIHSVFEYTLFLSFFLKLRAPKGFIALKSIFSLGYISCRHHLDFIDIGYR